MIIAEPAYFIKSFIDDLNNAIKTLSSSAGLTRTQSTWLGFCLMGILLVNSVCWAKFERASLGGYKLNRLSWMFCHSKIAWSSLFIASVQHVLKQHGITEGVLVLDETDRRRAKITKRIHKTYKQRDKKTNGYVNGQTIVMLLLVTTSISIPVGFAFYMPDPSLREWKKNDEQLKKEGVSKKDRPIEPVRNSAYPTKVQIALNLLQEFSKNHGDIQVQAVLADALYGENNFMAKASKTFNGIQVISQLRKNQNIWDRGTKKRLDYYFNKINKGSSRPICIRGNEIITVTVSSARLKVDAHGVKRFVIALKYEGEEDYRYLVATDMSWRTNDIIQAYSLRWLVEVFFSDWKLNEGWGREAKQYGEEGSSRGLILSLLLDHCLLLHPEQKSRIENKLPACTVGSLQRLAQMDALLEFITSLLKHKNPGEELKKLGKMIKEVFQLIPSGKHMNGRDLGRLEPTPSLKYRTLN
jgi:hypothetical protein